MMNRNFQLFSFLLIGVNLLFYLLPNILFVSKFINVTLIVIAVFLFKQKTILLLPFYIYSPIQYHSELPIFSLLVLMGLVFYSQSNRKLQFDKPLLIAIIFFVYTFATALWSDDLAMAMKYYSFYIKAILVVFLFSYLRRDSDIALKIVELTAIASGLAIFYKLLYVSNFELINMFSYTSADQLRGKVDLWYEGDYIRRLIFIGQEPNYAGVVQSLGLCTSFFLVHKAGLTKSRNLLLIGLACLISNYIQMVGSYSRSSFIIATLIVLGGIKFQFKTMIALFVCGILSILYLISTPSLQDRLLSIQTEKTGNHRTLLWGDALNLWSDFPFLGSGLSDYYSIFGGAAHSTYLQILSEQGLIGFFIFLLFLFYNQGLQYKGLATPPRYVYSGVIGFLIMIQTITFHQMEVLTYLSCLFGLIGMSATILKNEHKPCRDL